MQFLLAQGAAEIRQHQQLVRQTALAKRAAAEPQRPDAARKYMRAFAAPRPLGRRPGPSSPLCGRGAAPLGCASNRLPRAIHQPEPPLGVERKIADLDFAHHLPQQRGGFQAPRRCSRSVSPSALTSTITSPSAHPAVAARANGIIAFAQRRQQIRQESAADERHAVRPKPQNPARRRHDRR